MTITLKLTADSLDPNQTTENPEASLTAYVTALTTELKKAFVGCDVEHQAIDDTRAFDCESDDDADYHDDCNEIGRISGEVYETGNFWE